MTTNDSQEKLASLIDGIHVAMLATTDTAGDIRSRPMGSQGFDDTGRLTFFTSRDSAIVGEAAGHPVNVAFADVGKNTYVSISGHAELDTNRETIRQLWKPEYKAWFADGAEDPNIALLRVTVDSAEYWSTPGGPLTKLAEFAKAVSGNTSGSLGEHAKV